MVASLALLVASLVLMVASLALLDAYLALMERGYGPHCAHSRVLGCILGCDGRIYGGDGRNASVALMVASLAFIVTKSHLRRS